jgi:hypothetical protein
MSATTILASDLLRDFPEIYKQSNSNQLFIDIDTEDQFTAFADRVGLFQSFRACVINVKISKSGLPHRHIYVTLEEDYPVMDRLVMQQFLCSDPVRDFLSYIQHLDGEENPIIFCVEGEASHKD